MLHRLQPVKLFGVALAAIALVSLLGTAPAAAQTGYGPYPPPAVSAGAGYGPSAPQIAAAYAAGPAASSSLRYVVRFGDTLLRIAARFGVSATAILRANPGIRNPNRIFAGQVLLIPGQAPGTFLYTVRFGDTLARIAARFGTTVQAILRANPGIRNRNLIFAGQRLVIPSGSVVLHQPLPVLPPVYPPPAPGMPPMPPIYPPAPGMTPAPAPTMAPAPTSAPPPAATATPAPQAATIDLVAQNMAFNQSTITVPAGAQVTVHFTNRDAVPHNFAVFTDSSAQQVIFRGQIITGPNATVTYTFTAPSQPGAYFFHCDVHPTMMFGQFVVR